MSIWFRLSVLCFALCLFMIWTVVLVGAETTPSKTERQFSAIEKLLYETPHLDSVRDSGVLVYQFERQSVFGDGFKDRIKLNVRDEGSRKSVKFDFFSAERRRPYPPFSDVTANPLLTLYFNKDAWDLARRIKAKGVANYLRNRIIDAISTAKEIEPVMITYQGKDISGQRIRFAPFIRDENRHHLVHYAALEYQVTLSAEIPGMIYEIVSTVPGHKGEVPAHVLKRLKKAGMLQLAGEAEQINKKETSTKPLIVERLRFDALERGNE